MNGTIDHARFFSRLTRAAGLSALAVLLSAGAALAQAEPRPPSELIPAGPESAPPPDPVLIVGPAPLETTEAPLVPFAETELELQLRGGVSVATIQVDGAAATGFLPGVALAFRQGMLLVGAAFDVDPSVDNGAGTTSAESRSGWHLGGSIGPAFQLSNSARLDLSAEFGLHHLQDSIVQPTSSYSTSGTLPYFGVHPAISAQFGSGDFRGAVGAAVFFRVDAGQRQPSGLPDDGGHQLGLEAFLSLRIPIFGGK